MKRNLLKLALCAMAALPIGAWAQTTLYYRTLTGAEEGATQWSASDIGTGKWETTSGTPTVSISENVEEVETVTGLKSLGIGEIANSTQITPSANVRLTIDAVWVYNGGNSNDNNEYLQIGNSIRINANPKETAGNVTFNSTDVRSITNACSTSAGTRWTDTWTIHAEINTATNKVTALTVTGASATNTATFTLTSPVELTGTPVYNTISMGQNNRNDSYVLLKSLKITETPRLAYSIIWKSGDTEMGTFVSDYDFSGASITIPYYRYLCKDNKLYGVSTGNDKDVSTASFTLSTDNQTEYMTGYSALDKGYIVYCEEAENISGMTAASTYTMTRCSGQKAAYCSENVKITTLPAGTYIVCIGVHGNASNQTFKVIAGGTDVLSYDFNKSSTRSESISDPFTIGASTDIYINGGVSGTAFDNIYIVCTSGRVATVDNLGYTFSSTLPLDFTGTTVEAYTAEYNSTTKKVTMNRVYKVPANTGLFIKGTADDIPVLTGDADGMGTNNLVAVSSATNVAAIDGDNTNYVLALADKDDTSKGVVFLKASGAEVAAGKAYLQIPTGNAPLSRISVMFDDDETTGIEELKNSKTEELKSYYNLNGQRVAHPTKGLYIVNGKKVIMK